MPRGRAWSDNLIANVLAGSTHDNVDLLAGVTDLDTMTVVRLVGHLWVVPTEEGTAGFTIQSISCGVQVVSDEALTAGAVAHPAVANDVPSRGWLWRAVICEYIRTVSNVTETWLYPEVRFDIRAARKVDRGKLVLTMEKAALSGTQHDVMVVGIVRALVLT